jgi:hypothetical protein
MSGWANWATSRPACDMPSAARLAVDGADHRHSARPRLVRHARAGESGAPLPQLGRQAPPRHRHTTRRCSTSYSASRPLGEVRLTTGCSPRLPAVRSGATASRSAVSPGRRSRRAARSPPRPPTLGFGAALTGHSVDTYHAAYVRSKTPRSGPGCARRSARSASASSPLTKS